MNPYCNDTAHDRTNSLDRLHRDGRIDRHSYGDAGPVPVDFAGVLVERPGWARLLVPVAAVLAPVGHLLDRMLVTAVWAGLPLVGGLIVTGHASWIGLSDTPTGIPPLVLAVAAVGALIIGVVAADVLRFGRANKVIPRADHDTRRHRPVDPVVLPDDPDLNGPNGFTGPGTTPPGTPDATWSDR